jgi:hypothetical protein
MPDVGDIATLTLTINPADVTTVATVAAVNPVTAAVTAPSVTLVVTAGVGTATALLPLTHAGAWAVTWTVTGQGLGVEKDIVYAFGPIVGKTYATLTDLANFTGYEPEASAGRLLVKATARIDTMLIGARYGVDDDGLPTDPDVAAALRDAVCAQVAWWGEQGDTTGSGTAADWGEVTIGRVKLSRNTSGSGFDTQTTARRISAESVEILRVAGLIPIYPLVHG